MKHPKEGYMLINLFLDRYRIGIFNHSVSLYSLFSLQPLRLDIKRKLSARSDRVKCVDLHPTEPWMLASLYNGNVHVWNHESQVNDI